MKNKNPVQRLWILAHRYVGLTVGLLIVLLGLTGSVSVFWRELHEITIPELRIAGPEREYRPYQEIVKSLNAAFPNRPDEWALYLPWYRNGVLYAVYEAPEERAGVYESPLYVAIDPYTAKVMGHYYWGETAVSWIYNLHAFLQAGPAGMTLVGIIGIVFLLLALSGLYLWWPIGRFSRRQFTFTRKQGFPRFEFDWHRVGGFYSLIVLVVIAVSGIMIVFPEHVGGALNTVAPMNVPLHLEGDEPLKSAVQPGVQPITIDEAIARARKIFPVGELRTLYVPGGPEVALGVTVRQPGEIFDRHYPNSETRFDQYTGEVLRVIDPLKFNASRRFMTMSVPFHGGEALGTPGRWLLFVAGFMPLLFFVTGLRRWLRDRRFDARQTP